MTRDPITLSKWRSLRLMLLLTWDALFRRKPKDPENYADKREDQIHNGEH